MQAKFAATDMGLIKVTWQVIANVTDKMVPLLFDIFCRNVCDKTHKNAELFF